MFDLFIYKWSLFIINMISHWPEYQSYGMPSVWATSEQLLFFTTIVRAMYEQLSYSTARLWATYEQLSVVWYGKHLLDVWTINTSISATYKQLLYGKTNVWATFKQLNNKCPCDVRTIVVWYDMQRRDIRTLKENKWILSTWTPCHDYDLFISYSYALNVRIVSMTT